MCAYCQVVPPFTITNAGIKIEHPSYMKGNKEIRYTISRRAWELEMLDHLKAKHHQAFLELIEDLRSGRQTQVQIGIIVQYPAESVVTYRVVP